MKSILELFSGTHSVGKILKGKYNIISLDRDLGDDDNISDIHIQEDIMTWDYKIYPSGIFDVIWASPVCLWWSVLRRSHIGRVIYGMDRKFTMDDIHNDIDKYGKPMVDKILEIIDYFKPKYYIIENPQTGMMKTYITDLPYYDIDYCKYSDWGYKKRTRFWTNIKGFEPKLCKNDCDNLIINGKCITHKANLGSNTYIKDDNNKLICVNTKELRLKYKDYNKITKKKTSLLDRYRIPPKLITELFNLL